MPVKQVFADKAFVRPYLPRLLLDWYGNSAPGLIHHTTDHEGIVACLDVSGFTKLTCQLSIDKKLGPEKLTNILNRFFEAITDLTFHYQGDILKFAGDAVWIYFPETVEIGRFFQQALSAVEDLNLTLTDLQQSPIGLHMGAESGSFGLGSMGKEHFRLEAEPFGPLINDVMHACDLATTGQMVMGPRLASRRPQFESLPQPENGFYLWDHLREEFKTGVAPETLPVTTELPHDIRLEQYLPIDLVERAKFTAKMTSAQSEFREVTVLVANFRLAVCRESDQTRSEIALINSRLASAFEIILDSNGSISRIDPFYDGHKLLALFGAPKKHEHDELNALHCATRLLELEDVEFDLRLGLANGALFCGDVGSNRRREYTVMGEAVNMAVRLMTNAAWGRILIDNDLRNRLPDSIATDSKKLTLKGIGNDISCHQFREIIEQRFGQAANNTITGRESEYQQLKKFLSRPSLSRIEVMTITGEAGAGKSTLIHKVVDEDNNIPSITIEGRHSFLYGHAWIARTLIHELFSISGKASGRSLKDFVDEKIESNWLPLLGDIIDISLEDSLWIRGLSQKQRNQRTAELYGLLAAALMTDPVAVVIDDFDQIDDYSRQILLHLLNQSESLPGKFILISREDLFTSELLPRNFTSLVIPCPTDSEWGSYFARFFSDGKREKELTARLIDISQGNPRFIAEFIGNLQQQNKLEINRVTGQYELIKSFSGSEIPTSINDIYLSKFDLCSEADKRLLKSAAVFETRFSLGALSAVTGNNDERGLERQLRDLVKDEILEYDLEGKLIGFADKTFQGIINSCLPESFLTASHTKAVAYLEASGDSCSPSVLAHHYFKSKQWRKAYTFSLTAAKEALRYVALSDASSMFQQCEIALESSADDQIPTADIYEFYTSYNAHLILEGDLDRAYRLLNAWQELAVKDGNNSQYISAVLEQAQLDWQQSKYIECRQVLEGVLKRPDIHEYASLIGRIHSILAEVERRSGNFSLARTHCQRSLSSYKELNDNQGLSDSYNKLGLALWGEGKLDEAAENYELSLQYGRGVNGMFAQSQTSNNLAIIKWEQGDFINAEHLMRDALDITKQIGDRRVEAYVSGNLSSIQNILGRFSSSRKLLLQADLIFTRLKDTHAHNYVIGNLGDIDLIEGNSDAAGAKFHEVIEFATEVEDKELLAECQIRLGELLFYTGNIGKAETKYLEAIKLADQIESSEYFMRSAIGLCRLYIGERVLDKIDPLVERTLAKANSSNSVLVKNEIDFVKGELKRLSNDLSEANRYYQGTLEYALQQNVFELTLKSTVRLYENDNSFKNQASEIVSGLRRQFNLDNGEASWGDLMHSCYYQFFSKTIGKMAK